MCVDPFMTGHVTTAPPKDSGGSVPRGITFDRFLMACVTVKHFTEAFRRRDARNEGKLTIDYNTFVSPADTLTKAASWIAVC